MRLFLKNRSERKSKPWAGQTKIYLSNKQIPKTQIKAKSAGFEVIGEMLFNNC